MKPSTVICLIGTVAVVLAMVVAYSLHAPWWVFVLAVACNVLGYVEGRSAEEAERS